MEKNEISRFANRKNISLTCFDLTEAILEDRAKVNKHNPSAIIDYILMSAVKPLYQPTYSQMDAFIADTYCKEDAATRILRQMVYMLCAANQETPPFEDTLAASPVKILTEMLLAIPNMKADLNAHTIQTKEDFTMLYKLQLLLISKNPHISEKVRCNMQTAWLATPFSLEFADNMTIVRAWIETIKYDSSFPGFATSHLCMLSALLNVLVIPNTPEVRLAIIDQLLPLFIK